MKYDREEAYLREKLTDGLHPADVDLWPAVAEHLPDARPARHWRRLCICLAAPLLIAAGVLAGTAEFTNLRENPRPSFAPEANTGYAITYERQYFTLDGDLMAGLVANHNGETAADGTKPASGSMSGSLHPSEKDMRNVYAKAARGYGSWDEMTAATGLPLVQNAVLDAGETDDGSAIALFTDDLPQIPVGTDGRVFMVLPEEYPAGFIPIGRGETPEKLIDSHIIMVSHNRIGCTEKADQAHKSSLDPLLPAFVSVHTDPFHQHICLSNHLHIDLRTDFFHKTYQFQTTDHTSFFAVLGKMINFDGF